MSKPPKANRTRAVTTAVTTIRRPTARCVSASKCFVFSRKGTSAISTHSDKQEQKQLSHKLQYR